MNLKSPSSYLLASLISVSFVLTIELKMNSCGISLTLLLLLGLLAVIYAEPGKVYINGQCIDCNKPDNDDNIVIPPKVSGAMSCSSLNQGALAFGLFYYVISWLHI